MSKLMTDMRAIMTKNILAACAALVVYSTGALASHSVKQQPVSPMPAEIVVQQKTLAGAPPASSPDGNWVAVTATETPPTLHALDSKWFSTTGVPFGLGPFLYRTHVVDVRSGKTIALTEGDTASWGPSWSPDGRSLAYYSDRDGVAGLWLWDPTSKQSRRVGDFIIRPFWAFQVPRWSSDGKQLLVLLLPNRMTVAEANARAPKDVLAKPEFPAISDGAASVLVFRSDQQTEPSNAGNLPDPNHPTLADLAIVDIESGKVTRIAERILVSGYAFSPDKKHVAYSHLTWVDPKSYFDIELWSSDARQSRVLAQKVESPWGTQLAWSPDSRHIAHVRLDYETADEEPSISLPDHRGGIEVLALTGETISFPSIGRLPSSPEASVPHWSANGAALYSIGDGALWRLDLESASVQRVTQSRAVRLTRLVQPLGSDLLWQDKGRLWAFARDTQSHEGLIVQIDPKTGAVRSSPLKASSSIHDVSQQGGIAYTGKDRSSPYDEMWIYDTRAGKGRQLTQLNSELARYSSGDFPLVRISWTSLQGEELNGALVLPAGYTQGKRVPVIATIYEGRESAFRQSALVKFPSLNELMYLTRGYAVFQPDIPIKNGEVARDTYAAVMPGIDAIIEQGYADPHRIALHGSSFGSYMIHLLLTQTGRFKAAVTEANVIHPDLFAAYSRFDVRRADDRTGWFEKGQANMGDHPWALHDRYFRNSPFFKLDKVTTPLLMGQGYEDMNLDGANTMFVALRRLGRHIEYRLYDHDGHIIMKRANVIDWWNSQLRFLGEHLGTEGVAVE